MCSPYNYATTLRSDRHRASQSFFDASFIVEGPSGRFVDRTAIFERSRPKLADREFEWARVRKNGCSGDCASTNPQVSALRSSLCAACSSRSTSLGNPRTEEEGGVISFPLSPLPWTARNRSKKANKRRGRRSVRGLRSMSQST